MDTLSELPSIMILFMEDYSLIFVESAQRDLLGLLFTIFTHGTASAGSVPQELVPQSKADSGNHEDDQDHVER